MLSAGNGIFDSVTLLLLAFSEPIEGAIIASPACVERLAAFRQAHLVCRLAFWFVSLLIEIRPCTARRGSMTRHLVTVLKRRLLPASPCLTSQPFGAGWVFLLADNAIRQYEETAAPLAAGAMPHVVSRFIIAIQWLTRPIIEIPIISPRSCLGLRLR